MRSFVYTAALVSVAALAAPAQADTSRVDSFYVEAKGGLVIPFDSKVDDDNSQDVSYDVGFTVGGAAGYQFKNGLRFEIAGHYLEVEEDGGNDLEAEVGTFLVNAYYDLNMNTRITPYIGVGLGFSDIELNNFNGNSNGFDLDDGAALAYAAHAGLSFEVTPRLDATFNYTFLGHDVDLLVNQFTAGIRAEF